VTETRNPNWKALQSSLNFCFGPNMETCIILMHYEDGMIASSLSLNCRRVPLSCSKWLVVNKSCEGRIDRVWEGCKINTIFIWWMATSTLVWYRQRIGFKAFEYPLLTTEYMDHCWQSLSSLNWHLVICRIYSFAAPFTFNVVTLAPHLWATLIWLGMEATSSTHKKYHSAESDHR